VFYTPDTSPHTVTCDFKQNKNYYDVFCRPESMSDCILLFEIGMIMLT